MIKAFIRMHKEVSKLNDIIESHKMRIAWFLFSIYLMFYKTKAKTYQRMKLGNLRYDPINSNS